MSIKNIYQIIILSIFLLLTGCANSINNLSSNKLTTLIHLLDTEYVDEINSSKITDSAIINMVETLDAHSHYLTSKEVDKLFATMHGEFGGIGISLGIHNSLLTIISPIPNSPADKIGLKAEDIVIKINNNDTLGLTLNQCIALTSGKIGTDLNLTIMRNHSKQPLFFSIRRKNININVPTAQMLTNDILYIRVPSFNQKSSAYVYYFLRKFPHYKKLILDLRFNPGGILSQAVSFVNMFIDKGLIVTQKSRHKKYYEEFWATKELSDTIHPMAILINKGSASASEIVAGALQVYKRATIVGEKSFGKGSVQTLFNFEDGSALKLTIGKYYLPNGKCIHGIGIQPDIVVKNLLNTKYKTNMRFNQDKVKNILKKLKNGTLNAINIPKNVKPDKSDTSPILTQQKIFKDRQLLKAIEVLKNSN